MIKKLEAEDIVQILNNPDFPSGKMFNYDKGQWVQFLMQSIKNNNVLMIGRSKENKLQSFSVTIHNKGTVFSIYISDDIINDDEFKAASMEWHKKFKTKPVLKNMRAVD